MITTTREQIGLAFIGLLVLSGGVAAVASVKNMPAPQEKLADFLGTYCAGSLGSVSRRLDIDENRRFRFSRTSDDAAAIRIEGEVEIGASQFVFKPKNHDSELEITGSTPLMMYPIRWGDRRYLLAEKQLLSFCNAVNLGLEPRRSPFGGGAFYVMFFLDHGKTGDKAPRLPEEWNQFLLPEPIQGEICEVLPGESARVTLGRRDGVRVGMCLVLENSNVGKAVMYTTVIVDSVDDRMCVVSTTSGRTTVLRLKQRIMSRFPKNVDISDRSIEY
jgi:hypothetical protein